MYFILVPIHAALGLPVVIRSYHLNDKIVEALGQVSARADADRRPPRGILFDNSTSRLISAALEAWGAKRRDVMDVAFPVPDGRGQWTFPVTGGWIPSTLASDPEQGLVLGNYEIAPDKTGLVAQGGPWGDDWGSDGSTREGTKWEGGLTWNWDFQVPDADPWTPDKAFVKFPVSDFEKVKIPLTIPDWPSDTDDGADTTPIEDYLNESGATIPPSGEGEGEGEGEGDGTEGGGTEGGDPEGGGTEGGDPEGGDPEGGDPEGDDPEGGDATDDDAPADDDPNDPEGSQETWPADPMGDGGRTEMSDEEAAALWEKISGFLPSVTDPDPNSDSALPYIGFLSEDTLAQLLGPWGGGLDPWILTSPDDVDTGSARPILEVLTRHDLLRDPPKTADHLVKLWAMTTAGSSDVASFRLEAAVSGALLQQAATVAIKLQMIPPTNRRSRREPA